MYDLEQFSKKVGHKRSFKVMVRSLHLGLYHQPVLVRDNVPQNFQCPGRPGRDMSWTCPGHFVQDYIYILHI
jgi:hypothetical protein